MTILLAADSAQFRGLIGVGVKKAQATLSSGGSTGFACLRLTFATIFVFGCHILFFSSIFRR